MYYTIDPKMIVEDFVLDPKSEEVVQTYCSLAHPLLVRVRRDQEQARGIFCLCLNEDEVVGISQTEAGAARSK